MGYPDNMPSSHTFKDTQRCSNRDCRAQWEATFITDLGMTDYADERMHLCPDCGSEALI